MEQIEFSRVHHLTHPQTFTQHHTIEATPDECLKIASRLKILSVDFLRAEYRLTPESDTESYRIHGTIAANFAQESVVTLKPVPQSLKIPFHVKIRVAKAHELTTLEENTLNDDLDLEDDADIEVLCAPHVDVGELVVQYLALSLDPYPKNEGEFFNAATSVASMQQPDNTHSQEDRDDNPFAVLQKLKTSPTKNDPENKP